MNNVSRRRESKVCVLEGWGEYRWNMGEYGGIGMVTTDNISHRLV